jgi:hypothetical protein
MYFSGYAEDEGQVFLRTAGFDIQSARVHTVWEKTERGSKAARFLWTVAQRPLSAPVYDIG